MAATVSKDEAIDLLEKYRREFLYLARGIARRLAADGRAITVDDVRKVCPPPDNIDPRVMGAVFRQADWEPTGFVNSARKTCHKRPVRLFVLKDTIDTEGQTP